MEMRCTSYRARKETVKLAALPHMLDQEGMHEARPGDGCGPRFEVAVRLEVHPETSGLIGVPAIPAGQCFTTRRYLPE
jgi:hypothetical protein